MDYTHFFHLKTDPFNKQSCGSFSFESKSYREAIQRMEHIVQNGGIFYLCAEYGIGKSSLLYRFSQNLAPKIKYVYLDYVKVGAYGILYQIAKGLFLIPGCSKIKVACALKDYFIKTQDKPVIIIDEAQDLNNDTLEDIRMLTSQYFDTDVPFTLIFSGHPSFSNVLNNHQALKQRINFSYQLLPFSASETASYLNQRMTAAGCNNYPFDKEAEHTIFEYSKGIARKINKLATLSLIIAAGAASAIIDRRICESAIMEMSANF